MSISAFTIALQLVVAQSNPGSGPPVAPTPPAVEHQNVPARTAPAPEMADQPGADLQAANPANPESAIEPPAPVDTIVVTARQSPPPGDPLQALNAKSFSVVQSVDEAVTGPVARTYKKSVPSPVRSGLRNFLGNLEEPVVFLNYLLQLKPGKSAETLGRFAINSTIGGAGLLDVAKRRPFKLPHRRNGFGYTLGYYGVKPGPYMYLPLIGPTTVRDLGGRLIDLSVLPMAVGKPFSELAFVVPTTTVRLIDERAEADDEIRTVRDGDADPYSAVRAHYLRERQAEIDALRGKHPQDRAP